MAQKKPASLKDSVMQALGEGREKRLLLASITLILMAAAAASILIGKVQGGTSLASCRRIILAAQRYSCIGALANSTGNYSLCGMLPTNVASYGCLRTIAMARGNASICKGIANGSDLSSCVTNVSLSTGIDSCGELGQPYASECGFELARKGKFSTIASCTGISNSSLRSMCDGIYYYGKALSERNQSYCALVPNDTNSSDVSSIITRDYTQANASYSNIVSYLSINASARDFCYLALAESSRNESMCAEASNSLSGLCSETVNATLHYNATISNITSEASNLTNTASLCSSEPSYAKPICLFSVFTEKALSEQNASLCSGIGNATMIQSCVVDVAAHFGNSGYCKYIGNTTAYEACVNSATAVLNAS